MTTIARYALPGGISGALTAAAVFSAPTNLSQAALYAAPGLLFGILVGGMFLRDGKLPLGRLVAYVAAAVAANAAAVYCAIASFDAAPLLFDSEIATLALIGLAAGFLGAGLLTAASLMLLPLRGIAVPVATGTVGGVLLPAFVDGEIAGGFAFYIVWQAAYAGSVAWGLPPKRRP